MGWHYTLSLKCVILPEWASFIEEDYLRRLGGEGCISSRVGWALHSDSDDDDDDDETNNRVILPTDEQLEMKKRMRIWKAEMNRERAAAAKEYEQLPKNYKDLIDIWRGLNIDGHFYEYEYEAEQREFHCEISKRVTTHHGDLREAYEGFLRDIIVPISSRITSCTIASDDYGDVRWVYTDTQLRGGPFRLQDKIKCIEHVFSEDGGEIIETRVIYKRSIDVLQRLDLDREYGVSR